MLPRKTYGAWRNCAGIFGLKLETPPERAPFHLLEAGEVDAPPGERLQLLHGIVVADDAHELHRREAGGRRGKEGRGAAKDLVGLAERGLDRIQRDGADDEKGHGKRSRV
jgi:hypothetical protein